MSTFCGECLVPDCILSIVREEDRPLALNVAQGLSGAMLEAVSGTQGLTEEGIEAVRQDELASWGDGTDEARLLEAHPELAQDVYVCTAKIAIQGTCSTHSA